MSSFPFIITDLGNSEQSSLALFDKPALIVSQTCDLQRRPFIQVCPVHTFAYLKAKLVEDGKSDQGADSFIEGVRNRKGANYYFYLPSDEAFGIEEGYADLGVISTVARKQLLELPRTATITDYPRHILSYQVGNLYSRPH